jgi:hypothetical protein
MMITAPAAIAETLNKDSLKMSLIGIWKLDFTPNKSQDNNFAKMTITKIDKNQVFGEFYRDGVEIVSGHMNTQLDHIHVALVSSDNSGNYNSSFYLKDGILYGTTHAIERDFLAVWTATKI